MMFGSFLSSMIVITVVSSVLWNVQEVRMSCGEAVVSNQTRITGATDLN